MSNNTFYKKVKDNPDEITWKYVFSDFRKKHSKQDFDRVMQRGTPLMMANADPVSTWEKPWLFYAILKIGLLLYLIIYGMIFLIVLAGGACSIVAINLFAVIVPPLILPVVLMVLFWELNIPSNISFGRTIIYFIVGGFLSLVLTILLGDMVKIGNSASLAPFTEEPAKLLISILFIWLFTREHSKWKIFGLTGLVIGAAVGAGFGGFESVQYGLMDTAGVSHTELFQYIDSSGLGFLIGNHFTRGIWAVAGHTLFCAPYSAAIALHMKDGKITKETFLNRDFAQTFIVSFACHFFWNTFGYFVVYVVITLVLWINALFIIKKCFAQVASGSGKVLPHKIGKKQSDNQVNFQQLSNKTDVKQCAAHFIIGEKGYLSSKKIPIDQQINIGRASNATIRFPDSCSGVSRMHCRLEVKNDTVYLMDFGSSYGTYINGDNRVPPNHHVEIEPGTIIYLGSSKEVIRIQ